MSCEAPVFSRSMGWCAQGAETSGFVRPETTLLCPLCCTRVRASGSRPEELKHLVAQKGFILLYYDVDGEWWYWTR